MGLVLSADIDNGDLANSGLLYGERSRQWQGRFRNVCDLASRGIGLARTIRGLEWRHHRVSNCLQNEYSVADQMALIIQRT